MNLKKILLISGSILVIAAVGIFAADHIDAPAVEGTTSDITDLYAFQAPDNNSNLVFNVNTQGLLSPSATQNASFDPSQMIEINIDNNGDLVEDLVIQCVFTENEVFAYGPTAPPSTGTTSGVNLDAQQVSTEITQSGESPVVGTSNGISLFAGPRDDPFFFDFERYTAIINGNESSFRDPGVDTFAGTNVMSLVVEVPKNMLGNAETLNVWATTNSRTN
ncbi:protein of unknown function (DUF4331) [Fodinibius salinus]|uniref:Molecular chaperone DnaK n=1 Tax=Fodinibius salinus TaxID=860790 RepID=A0A5D3YQ35_9BACT|nr:DUF4331 family protein [Fodinibius salinus]TYP95093.1 protein of unknown function (DUF4331) [Fodinibius salinus]